MPRRRATEDGQTVPAVQVGSVSSADSAYTLPFREISRPGAARPTPVAPRAVALGAHLPPQEDDQADDERYANHQRWRQRREILPHGPVLPATHRGRYSRWAGFVSCVTPMLISSFR